MKKKLVNALKSKFSYPNKISLLFGRWYDGSIKINYDDKTYWYKNGVLHREDGPAFLEEMENGFIYKEWRRNGVLHRENGPAIESFDEKHWYTNGVKFLTQTNSGDYYYDKNGDIHNYVGPAINFKCGCKEWRIHGKRHRENDLPAIIQCSSHRNSKEWFINNKLHRINGPAKIIDNNDFYSETWFQNDKISRDDGPASIVIQKRTINENNKKTDVIIKGLSWYKNGKLHRIGKPAYVSYINGLPEYEEFSVNGKLHNSIGPAKNWYKYEFTEIEPKFSFFLNNKEISLNCFVKLLEKKMNL